MRDVVTGSCVMNFGGESPSRKFLKSVRRTCECMTDGYEKVLDAKRVLEVTGLPPDKADAAPENAQMRVVIDACMRSTDLLGAAKEEAKQPISQKMREDFLVGCAMKEREKADDIEDGERKLADSCRPSHIFPLNLFSLFSWTAESSSPAWASCRRSATI